MASSSGSSLLSKSLATASSLMMLQLLSRIVTFVLNQSLVRLASPAVFGTASIQFELLLSTILFLSREGVRNALLRASSNSKENGHAAIPQSVVNISLLPTLLGIPIALLSTSLYLYTTSSITRAQPHFTLSVLIYAAAAILELVSEPLYIRAQNELQFGIRVKAEGTAVIVKAATTVAIIVLGGEELALLGFAIGQGAYGLTILGAFWTAYPGRPIILPSKVTESVHGNVRSFYFDPQLLRLSFAMTTQSLIKHFLTEGDKFVLSRISTLEDQGGYAVASNYGSLVARIVFQPIEETSRVYFSKTLSVESDKSPEVTTQPPPEKEESAAPSPIAKAFTALTLLLLLDTYFTLLLASFLPPYLSTVLSLLLPPRYHATSAPQILALYRFLLPAMAFNGVLEAFFAAIATPEALRKQSKFLVATSVAYGGLVWFLVNHLGWTRTGLVWANLANLSARALWAGWFARGWFASRGQRGGWTGILPSGGVLSFFAATAAVLVTIAPAKKNVYGLGSIGKPEVLHVTVGVVLLILDSVVCYFAENAKISKALRILRQQ